MIWSSIGSYPYYHGNRLSTVPYASTNQTSGVRKASHPCQIKAPPMYLGMRRSIVCENLDLDDSLERRHSWLSFCSQLSPVRRW
ncbi:hypothetical protein Ciccas_007636 [Cichlidogyrus casuarinus]|uniref:Uncharacterized protein n=1 Tax=Cichlidogyrus casuarinus TaxID=1844966 RepID=A0ABD2Q2A2_9PLAT